MKSASRIARLIRVQVRLHYTWYLAFILMAAIVVNQFPVLYQLWQRIALGLAAGLVFFLIIGIRQFILVLTASYRNVPLNHILLFVFGGASQLTREDNSPVFEVLMGVAGILLNLVLAIVFYLVHMVLVIAGSVMMAGLIQWLAFIILMLTFFHIVPGYPLDCSRILLAILWKRTGDYYRSVYVTAWIGWTAGLMLIIYGIILLANRQEIFTGITLVLVGLSLERAATRGRRQASLRWHIQDISAQDIMSRQYPVVNRKLSVGQLVSDYVLLKPQHYFVVVDDAVLQGIVTLDDIKSTAKKKWDLTLIGEIMTPAGKVRTVNMTQPGDIVLEHMEKWGVKQLPVLEGNAVAGIVSYDDLIRLSQSRIELKS